MFNLVRKFYEWSTAKSSPRFRLFREAKELYLNFLKEYPTVSVEELPPLAKDNAALCAAEEKYNESIRLAEEEMAYTDVATGNYQLGFLYSVQGRYEEAVAVFQTAITILENLPALQAHERQTLRDCYFNMGLAKLYAKDYASARVDLELAKKMNEEAFDSEGVNLAAGALATCQERDV